MSETTKQIVGTLVLILFIAALLFILYDAAVKPITVEACVDEVVELHGRSVHYGVKTMGGGYLRIGGIVPDVVVADVCYVFRITWSSTVYNQVKVSDWER